VELYLHSPNTPSLRGAYLKHRENFTFYLLHRLGVFENSVLRRIFGPKREEDGSWRKAHNDEFHSLYSSPNIVKVVKSRWMRWQAWGGVLVGSPKVRDHWEDLGVGGKITLR
jgi:hypothetical protein